MGSHLGLRRNGASIIWAGHSGLQYNQVFTIVNSLRQCSPPPQFLVLHSGGNGIGREPCGTLRNNIQAVISQLMLILPYTQIVWSCILPRLQWRYSNNIKAMEACRSRVNRAIMHFLLRKGHKTIKHTDFQDKLPALYLKDGVHLSYIGNDIFLNTVQAALQTFLNSNVPLYPVKDTDGRLASYGKYAGLA